MPLKKLYHKIPSSLVTLALGIFPFTVIWFVGRRIITDLYSPSWGDLVAMPTVRVPLSTMFYPWIDTYIGSIGSVYLPHVLFSQLLPYLSSSFLQFIHFYFVFLVLFVTLLDFFRETSGKKIFIPQGAFLHAALIILTIFFSNVFLVNFLQGSPDIYYTYLLTLPVIFYLYQLFIAPGLIPVLKMNLVIVIALTFAQFSLYYMAIAVVPYFLLFGILYRKNLRRVLVPLIIATFLLIITNLPMLYTTVEPALSAVGNILARHASVTALVSETYVLYGGINALNLLFFSGNSGDYSWILFNIPGGEIFRTNIFYSLLPLQIIITVLFILLYLKTKQKHRVSPLILGLLSLFICVYFLIIIWDAPFFIALTKNIPFMSLFRNPRKLIFMLYISFLALLVFMRFFADRKKYAMLLVSILLLNFLAVAPLVLDGYSGLKNTSDISLARQRISKADYQTYFLANNSFPERLGQLKNILSGLDTPGSYPGYRIMIVPDNNQSTYQNLRYMLNPFYVSGSYAIWADVDHPDSIMAAMYTLLLSREKDISGLLKIGNVKYIIIDRNAPYREFTDTPLPKLRSFYSTYTTGDPELFNKTIAAKENLSPVHTDNNFYIYENKKYQQSMVYIPEKVCDERMLSRNDYSCDLYVPERAPTNYMTDAGIEDLKRINQTTYRFSIDSSQSGKTVVFFNQAYNPDWEIRPQDRSVRITRHASGNSYGNTWDVVLPSAGSYAFTIFFRTQLLYAVFVVISAIMVLLNLIVLIVMERKAVYEK